MVKNAESTAAETVTSQSVSGKSVILMNSSYRSNLESYLVPALQAKNMLSMGILTPKDYTIIDTMLAEKYGISSCSIFCGIDLIYDGFRGNISHSKEVSQCKEQ
jgi:hypothetical protein